MSKEDVLEQYTIEGTVLKLPDIELERKLYLEVKKALGLIGGKWKGGKISGFVFQQDPSDLVDELINGNQRNLQKEFQFFATPESLAKELVEYADLKETDSILEPSAGQGAIIRAINENCTSIPDCYELMPLNVSILQKSGLKFNLLGNDFLQHTEKKYDKIVANPPFTKNQDIEHLQLMYKCLNEGGRIVCITSNSWVNGSFKKQVAFREWLDGLDYEMILLESGTFKESGTTIAANILIIDK